MISDLSVSLRHRQLLKLQKLSSTCILPGQRKQRNGVSNRQRKGKAIAFHPCALLTPPSLHSWTCPGQLDQPVPFPLPVPSCWCPSHTAARKCHFQTESTSKPQAVDHLGQMRCAHSAVEKRWAAPSRASQAAGRACSASRAACPGHRCQVSWLVLLHPWLRQQEPCAESASVGNYTLHILHLSV